jgi:DNA invertase Pin-like site-specific DNA recombinase
VDVISEKISGGVKNEERQGLTKLINLVRDKKIDIILIREASRLSRVGFQAARIINELYENGVVFLN